jgi:cellulose synthase operon protein C
MITEYRKALPGSAGVPPAKLSESTPRSFLIHAGETPALSGCNRWTASEARTRLKICGQSRFRICLVHLSTWILLSGLLTGNLECATQDIRCGAALRSGEYPQAIRCFESALNEKTNQEENQQGLLQALRETGAYQKAVKRSEEFLTARSNSALLHLERGKIDELLGNYTEAENYLRRSMALASVGSLVQMDAMRTLAELLEKVGRQADARKLWDLLIEKYREGRVQGSRQLGIVAVAAWHRGNEKDATNIFIDATDQLRGEVSLEALSDFGYLFLEKYDATNALGVFRDCLKINKSYPDALVGIALAKKYESNLDAQTNSQAAININPNLVPALNILATLALEEENPAAAEHHINDALAVNPSDLESLSLQAAAFYFRGDVAGFAKTENKILGINPSYGRLYYLLAQNMVSRRKYQEAVDFNRKAIALDSKLWAAYAGLGMNLTRIGELEEGRQSIQKAFDGDPYNIWAFNSLDLFDQMDTFVHSQSEHFRFLMSKEDVPVLTPYASELAEEAYAGLTQRYGFKPAGPIQIEIFPDHGGFAVRTLGLMGLEGALGVCFGKVMVLDSPRSRKADTFNWGTTLWHEFAHVITLQMTKSNIPRWYSEGLSVYEEHKARPGWGDHLTELFIKAYREGKLLKASQLNSGMMHPKYPEQIGISYYQAFLVCEWIEEKYGFDKIRQSLLLFAENKPAEEVFARTLGLDPAKMDAEYARFIDAHVRQIAANFNFTPQLPGETVKESPKDANKDKLSQILKTNPQDFFANLKMGTLLQKEGANTEAEGYLKTAQKLFPQYVEPGNPYQLLGQWYLASGRENEALAEFIDWSQRDDHSREPLMKAAEIYRNRKDWASAATTLKLSIYINPNDPDAQQKLAEAAMESKKWSTAIVAYRALVSLKTADPAGAHYDLARALMASGNMQEAKREILRSLEIAPTFNKGLQLLLKISGDTTE